MMAQVSTTPKPSFAQVFKTEVITNPKQSVSFMKKFTGIAVSTVLYLRTNFDAGAFERMKIDGVRVTMLVKKKDNPAAEMILNNISNAMVALQEGHLREFHVLFVRPDDPDHIIESHMFKFHVPKAVDQSGDRKLTPKEKEKKLRIEVCKLMKTICSVNQGFETLPEDMEMRIKLVFDEDTPAGYAPPGFISATPNTINKIRFAEAPPTPMSYGKFGTCHHELEAVVQSLIPREDQEISNSQGSQKSVCDETIQSDTNISEIMTDPDSPVYTSQLHGESPMINLPTGLGPAKTPVGNESFLADEDPSESLLTSTRNGSNIFVKPKTPSRNSVKEDTIGSFLPSKRARSESNQPTQVPNPPPSRRGRGRPRRNGAYAKPPNPKI